MRAKEEAFKKVSLFIIIPFLKIHTKQKKNFLNAKFFFYIYKIND